MPYCSACGGQVADGVAVCPACGKAVPVGAEAAQAPAGSAAGGLDQNVAGLLSYLFIPAIIFLAMEPYNRSSFVRFHAWQSIFLGVVVVAIHLILGVIPIIGWLLLFPVSLGFLVLWIIAIFKASKGERFKIPFIGNYAEQQAR